MSPRRTLVRLLCLGVSVVLLTSCSSSEQEATTTALPESRRSTAPTASPAPSTAPAPPASPFPVASAGAAAAQSATITVDAFDDAVPGSVAAGARVHVVNDDGEAHTVTIRGGSSIVVPPRGATMTFTAPAEAGTYQIVCDLHGDMTAQLIVT